MTASEILQKYIAFFEKKGHTRIANSSLVPENDPTTLFTSSGMQPLVPYLLGEPHPQGKRLVNAQNCFRAQDIDEIGDNRHTTFFRMLGNWSLGDYFKKEQIPWFFEFLTEELSLDPNKLYVTVFAGEEKFKVQKSENKDNLTPDVESAGIWSRLFDDNGIKGGIVTNFNNPQDISMGRIFYYAAEKNWWSRSGTPEKMPVEEIGGPDTEVFYDFGEELNTHRNSEFKDKPCHPNCDCGRFMEIGNSVFIQYKKIDGRTFEELPQKNVDFGGGLERLVAATENKQDVFETSLFSPIIKVISEATKKDYKENARQMRIITDHFTAAVFICSNNVLPSNKEQGYILRRLIRRGLDNYYDLNGSDIAPVLEEIIESYKDTDEYLVEKFEHIKGVILEEESVYKQVLSPKNINYVKANISTNEETNKQLISSAVDKYIRDEHFKQIILNSPPVSLASVAVGTIAFDAMSSRGLPPEQTFNYGQEILKNNFNKDEAEKTLQAFYKAHQDLSRTGAAQKFTGGLADHSEKTIMGHTATHLMHKALRDMLGENVHQTGSNITPERVRFDFNFDRKLTPEEIQKIEDTVNEKITENLPVHFEMMPLAKAKEIGAIGLFDDKYSDNVKVYFVGDYSKEFCGGPHVDFTGRIKRFKIIKEEGLGKGARRIYAEVF